MAYYCPKVLKISLFTIAEYLLKITFTEISFLNKVWLYFKSLFLTECLF